MSSATVETFCCMSSDLEPSIITHFQYQSLTYNIVCVISSVLGMLGAIYQVLPTSTPVPHRQRGIGHKQKAIINWLALADFFAASGILLRSAFWLWRGEIVNQNGWNLIVCSIFAFWIRYFYTATYLWTLFYAVDVYLVCKQKSGNQTFYHATVWTVSLMLSATGLGTLYLPHFQCHTGPWRVLPNYLLSYIPIVCVMIVNPILYFASSRNGILALLPFNLKLEINYL
ncbi:hypothetical protein JTE90_029436 [Oedothorax gibbosus]|uniref:Uncharacterized protein n=1 Tax=Oedothorax gibbosus TaxID=931172 RepID=A0AAV6TGR9_9ARAC|nr:hypothetical protein JTE90_029436 [Oedothorax gibbosus]